MHEPEHGKLVLGSLVLVRSGRQPSDGGYPLLVAQRANELGANHIHRTMGGGS
jgi:hypothetical protein